MGIRSGPPPLDRNLVGRPGTHKGQQSNREKMIEENAPAVAGSDTITGSIENDGRYDEPSEDDLEQMEKILEDAAESQGIQYEE